MPIIFKRIILFIKQTLSFFCFFVLHATANKLRFYYYITILKDKLEIVNKTILFIIATRYILYRSISNTDKHSVEYKNQRLIATPYCLFSVYSNYCSSLWFDFN